MIGGNHIQFIIQKGCQQGIAVVQGLNGRVPLDQGALAFIVPVIEPQVVDANLRGNAFLMEVGTLLKQFQLSGSGYMKDVKPGTMFSCQFHGQRTGQVAGLFASDHRMLADGDILTIQVAGLLHILLNGFLVLAVGGNQGRGLCKYLFQHIPPVHQHVSRG